MYIVCGLITPRMILSMFGSTYNGVVSSATQFLSMISILTLGIAGATRVELYKSIAAEDILQTSRIMKATNRYMRKVAFGVVVYAAVLIFVYPYISTNDLTAAECRILIAIVSIGTFVQYFCGISYATLLKANQQEYIYAFTQTVATIINTIAVACLIKLGFSIYTVKLATSVVFALSPIVMSIYVHRKFHLISNCEADETALKNRGAVAFHSIANIVHDNTDLLILTFFTDAKVISVYTVYYLVIGKIKNIMQAFTNGLEAAFGNMWARGEQSSIQRNFQIYEFAIFAFVSVVFSCIGLLIVPFVSIYTRGVTDVNYTRYGLAVLIALAEGMFCIRNPYLILVQATGSYQQTKNGAMWEAALNIVSSLVFVQLFGINGVTIGTLLANIFRTTQYAWYISKHILNRSLFVVVRRFGWLILNVACIVLPVQFMTGGIIVHSWIGWVGNAFLIFVFAVFVTCASAFLFYRSEMLGMLGFIQKAVRRRKK